MATATRIPATPPPPPPPPRDDVQLTLSYEEAETLQFIVGRVVGTDSRRKHSDAIWNALRGLGFRGNNVSGVWAVGNITFDKNDPRDGDLL